MTEDRAQADWPRCQADPSCAGAALQSWGRCLGHLDPDDLEQATKRAKTEGLDARGVTVTPSLLERIFSLLDRTDQDLPIVPIAGFDGATFRGRGVRRGQPVWAAVVPAGTRRQEAAAGSPRCSPRWQHRRGRPDRSVIRR